MIKDGWHKVKGFTVYIEDGDVIRGVKDNPSGIGDDRIGGILKITSGLT